MTDVLSAEFRLFDGYDTEDLAQEAIKFLQENEPEDGYYVAFSGGKDSQVILDLILRGGASTRPITTLPPAIHQN